MCRELVMHASVYYTDKLESWWISMAWDGSATFEQLADSDFGLAELSRRFNIAILCGRMHRIDQLLRQTGFAAIEKAKEPMLIRMKASFKDSRHLSTWVSSLGVSLVILASLPRSSASPGVSGLFDLCVSYSMRIACPHAGQCLGCR